MKRLLIAVLTTLVITGCAHKDLKAPCADVPSFNSGTVPCDQRKPVNTIHVPTIFAQ